MAKLYSDVLKSKTDEIRLQTVCGISLADQYGIHLIPGTNMKQDGNCFITMVMDQMEKRFFVLKESICNLSNQFTRSAFVNKISPTNVLHNRLTFAETCRKVLRKSSFDDGRSDMSWNDGWEKMKENGMYELDYFGDLFILGMYSIAWVIL
jgi:hypothetical protein